MHPRQERSTVNVNCCLPAGRGLSSNYLFQRHIVSNMTSNIQFYAKEGEGNARDSLLMHFLLRDTQQPFKSFQ